jgi:hypothetical protein
MDSFNHKGFSARLLSVSLVLAPMVYVLAQEANEANQSSGLTSDNAIAVHSNLVLVPTIVKTKHGENVFSLNADNFKVTDDGVPQEIRLDPDADAQPLALVVVVQTGAQGAIHLDDYRELNTVLEAIIGDVPHRVSVVSFDSQVRLDGVLMGKRKGRPRCSMGCSQEIKGRRSWTG